MKSEMQILGFFLLGQTFQTLLVEKSYAYKLLLNPHTCCFFYVSNETTEKVMVFKFHHNKVLSGIQHNTMFTLITVKKPQTNWVKSVSIIRFNSIGWHRWFTGICYLSRNGVECMLPWKHGRSYLSNTYSIASTMLHHQEFSDSPTDIQWHAVFLHVFLLTKTYIICPHEDTSCRS